MLLLIVIVKELMLVKTLPTVFSTILMIFGEELLLEQYRLEEAVHRDPEVKVAFPTVLFNINKYSLGIVITTISPDCNRLVVVSVISKVCTWLSCEGYVPPLSLIVRLLLITAFVLVFIAGTRVEDVML